MYKCIEVEGIIGLCLAPVQIPFECSNDTFDAELCSLPFFGILPNFLGFSKKSGGKVSHTRKIYLILVPQIGDYVIWTPEIREKLQYFGQKNRKTCRKNFESEKIWLHPKKR